MSTRIFISRPLVGSELEESRGYVKLLVGFHIFERVVQESVDRAKPSVLLHFRILKDSFTNYDELQP